MKTTLIIGMAMLMVGCSLAADAAQAQQTGSKRTDLQRHDLSAPGREVIQVRVDFDPGYVSPRHTHPGEERWLWADFGQSNTIVLAGRPRGQHKVLIEVVDPEGNVFTGQTVTFYSPGKQGPP